MALLDTVRGLLGRPPDDTLSAERQEFLRACADMGGDRLNRYRLYEDYYDGEQRTQLLDRAEQYLQASGLRWCENLVQTVVDVMADGLAVTGFEVQGNDEASEWLSSTWWPRTKMDETQDVVHSNTVMLGDGFLIVSFDENLGLPRAQWNHPSKVKPVYDDDGQDLLYASKIWSTTKRSASNPDGRLIMRLNVYWPDRVEKWFSWSAGEDSVWQPWQDEEDDAWPTPWTESQQLPSEGPADDPLGVPVPHFRNRPKGKRFGRSEVKTAIPFQDAHNKSVLDLFYVMDGQGWKQRWASGLSDVDAVKVAIGEWVTTANEAARFGEFQAENPGPLIETIDGGLRRLSAATGTPLHDLIKGDPPSGEALKTAEGRRVKKSEKFQTGSGGNAWEYTAKLAWKLQDVFGEGAPPYDPDAEITVNWESPETRNERLEAETLEAHHRLGASKQTILRKLGYDPDEEEEARQEEAEQSAEAMAKAFDRGGQPFGNGRDPARA